MKSDPVVVARALAEARGQKARESGAEILEDVHVNGRQREIWLRDLDGYVVVLAGWEGDVGDRIAP